MELKKIKNTVKSFANKYKFVFIILAAGIILMLLPTNLSFQESSVVTEHTLESKEDMLEERLAAILSNVSGAGRVEVLLTYRSGEETIYQENKRASADTTEADTAIITDGDRSQMGLVRQRNPGKCLGALIVCQGADNPNVKLSVVDAVSKVTGLGADQISVIKMK